MATLAVILRSVPSAAMTNGVTINASGLTGTNHITLMGRILAVRTTSPVVRPPTTIVGGAGNDTITGGAGVGFY